MVKKSFKPRPCTLQHLVRSSVIVHWIVRRFDWQSGGLMFVFEPHFGGRRCALPLSRAAPATKPAAYSHNKNATKKQKTTTIITVTTKTTTKCYNTELQTNNRTTQRKLTIHIEHMQHSDNTQNQHNKQTCRKYNIYTPTPPQTRATWFLLAETCKKFLVLSLHTKFFQLP